MKIENALIMVYDTSRYTSAQMVDINTERYSIFYNDTKKIVDKLMAKHRVESSVFLSELLNDARKTIPSFADEDSYNRSNYLLRLVTTINYIHGNPAKLVNDNFKFVFPDDRCVFIRIVMSEDTSMNDEAYLNEHLLRFKLDCLNQL